MVSLNNGIIRMDIDENGKIVWFENIKSGNGNIITSPCPLFRAAVLRTADAVGMGENKEDMAFADDQNIEVTASGIRARIIVHGLNTEMGRKNADLYLTAELKDDSVIFGGQIVNNSQSWINELFYPCVGSLDTIGSGAPDLLFPREIGERIGDICRVLKASESRQRLHEISETYPGYLSMSWMALTDDINCLYMACYDPKFHVMSLRAKGSENGGVSLEMDKLCYVKPGETWEIPTMCAKLYQGSWREGADEYSAWASGWRNPVEPREWMKHINGYFLVINKQQYGCESWPYEALPELYDIAGAHGFDCIGLFGWYHTGHDNNYPDLDVSPTMGGEEKLKEGIAEIQKKGGKVTLYYQGHLMDPTSPFYKKAGYKEEAKNIWGTPYVEFYPKFCYSDGLRFFSRKCFSTICPSSELWHKMMAERIEWIASFGADGALFDQIGGMPPYPCFDENHRHADGKPSLSSTQGRLKLYPAIRESVKKHENFAFMSEHITDIYSQFLDCVHGIGTAPGKPGSGIVAGKKNTGIGAAVMPEMFRYCFPETMITVRNSMPYISRRIVNFAFEYGFKFELELRYDTDRKFIRDDPDPGSREYVKKAAELRRKYEDYLLLGEFRADEGIIGSNVYANIFRTADGRRAAALWNDTASDVVPRLELESGTVSGWADCTGEGTGMPSLLGAGEIVLLFIK